MLFALLVVFAPPQHPVAAAAPAPLTVALAPATEDSRALPRWSPKGAKVDLHADGDALVGAFALGGPGEPAIAVRLSKSPDAEHYDTLAIDLDRDGAVGDTERLTTKPNEQRGKWWSSFTATARIAVPAAGDAPATTRPYPLALWFVADPREPEAAPVLRWSRRGCHVGSVEIGGRPAFVAISDMAMDGVFDQRDAWGLARDEAGLAMGAARSLEQHCWLDGVAYRATAIDAHGRRLVFEAFDPGFTEAEEMAKADVLKPDREAARAPAKLAFGADLAAALAAAKRDGKRVLLDFHTTWCGPCKTMDELVWTAADVVAAAADCVPVQLDGDDAREVVKRYEVEGYPTMLLLDADGKVLRRAVGYRSVKAMVGFLGR